MGLVTYLETLNVKIELTHILDNHNFLLIQDNGQHEILLEFFDVMITFTIFQILFQLTLITFNQEA